MADSIRERIIAAAAAAIDAATTTTVYRSRAEALTRRQSPAIVVEPGLDTLDRAVSSCKLDWSLTLVAAVYSVGSIPDQVADPVIQKIHTALMTDRSLGGIAYDCWPIDVDPQMDAGDPPSMWTVCRFTVRYRTSIADLTA